MSLSAQPVAPAAQGFLFEAFELHPARRLLLCHGTRVKLQPQPLRVLACLIQHAPDVVSRDTLAEAVWPGVHVDIDGSLNFCIRQIRAALDDSAAAPRFIETLPRQGYRFIADLQMLPGSGSLSVVDNPTPPAHLFAPLDITQTQSPEAPQVPRPPLSHAFTTRLRNLISIAVGLFVAVVLLAPLLLPRSRTVTIAPLVHPTPINPEAHDAYLRGRYLWFRGANEQAGNAFRRATELDPNYALAWSGLADYYGQGAGGTLDPRNALPAEEVAARKAVQLDPNSADAHLSLGAALYFNQWNFPAAQREVDRALELNPRLAQAMHFRAKILTSLEQHHDAIAAERLAAEVDPFARPWAMAVRLLHARRYDDARQAAQLHRQAEPANLDALHSLENIACADHRFKECGDLRAQRFDLLGDHDAANRLRHRFALGGYHAILLSDLADLKRSAAHQYRSPFSFASLYIQLGDRDQAIAALDQAIQQHAPDILLIQDLAIFDPLHQDPRYRTLIRRIGLPPAF